MTRQGFKQAAREALIWQHKMNYSLMENKKNQKGQSQPTV